MSDKKFYFRCKTNPNGPILVLDTVYEMLEMRSHPDYERIDEFGEVIVSEEEKAEHALPFAVTGAGARSKRA
jgi:hypothetical protein